MSKEYTYNDRMNQLARHQMLSEVQKTIMGSVLLIIFRSPLSLL